MAIKIDIREYEQVFYFMRGRDIMRLRTITEAVRAIQELDPQTALTRTALRRWVISGEIPSTRAGRKYLVDLDTLEQRLFPTTAEREVS